MRAKAIEKNQVTPIEPVVCLHHLLSRHVPANLHRP